MRHNPHRAKGGRHNNNYNNGNARRPSRNRVYDSNGPDVRIRGTAWQVTEKYQALAKDAEASGNWVLAESYYQHAEHYQRIINSFNEDNAVNADYFTAESEQSDGDQGGPRMRAHSAAESDAMAVA